MKIWIDTDIGDDVDDAFALLLAMNSEEIEIVGVSTVFCDVEKRAKIAKALLRAGGFANVPVYAGERKPLKQVSMYEHDIDFYKSPSSYCSDYKDIAYDGDDAVSHMAQAFAQENDMALVTIGALTNVAKLYLDYPEAAQKIQKIYVMGGAYNMNFTEYNFTCDPEAAAIVMTSKTPKALIGLDVTFHCGVSEEQLKMLKDSPKPAVKMLMSLISKWHGNVFLHDPLALMCTIDDRFVTFEPRSVRIETEGKYTRGMAINLSNYEWKHDPNEFNVACAVTVNAPDFTKECIRRILL